MNFFDPQSRKDKQAKRVSMAFFRISQAMKKISQFESDPFKLSPVQIQALFFIAYTREEMCSVGALAKAIATSHATAVEIIKGLMAKGLVTKAPKAEDRRVTILSLTDKGQKTVQQATEWGYTLEQIVGSISEQTLSNLEEGLGAMIHSLQAAGHLVVGEPCLGCVHFQAYAQAGEEPHYCNLVKKYLRHEASLKECPEHNPIR